METLDLYFASVYTKAAAGIFASNILAITFLFHKEMHHVNIVGFLIFCPTQ